MGEHLQCKALGPYYPIYTTFGSGEFTCQSLRKFKIGPFGENSMWVWPELKIPKVAIRFSK